MGKAQYIDNWESYSFRIYSCRYSIEYPCYFRLTNMCSSQIEMEILNSFEAITVIVENSPNEFPFLSSTQIGE